MPKGKYVRVKKSASTKETWAKRKPTPQDMMLNDFLSAKTAEEKRAVIEKFNELYFIFNKESKHEHTEQLQTSL